MSIDIEQAEQSVQSDPWESWRELRVTPLSGVTAGIAMAVTAIVVLVGVWLRFATTSLLWLDEALSVNIAKLPIGQIPGALQRDGAPPLYYVLLHWWMQVFGESDLAVRSVFTIDPGRALLRGPTHLGT